MSDTRNEWTLEGFVEYFDFFHHKMLDHKFVWVLGAGASLASGIPLGSDLVDLWLNELHVREDGGKTPLEDWATAENLAAPRRLPKRQSRRRQGRASRHSRLGGQSYR